MRRSVAGQRASRCRVGEPLGHARGTIMAFPGVGDTRTACALENGETPLSDRGRARRLGRWRLLGRDAR
jgi:hypothetical protein